VLRLGLPFELALFARNGNENLGRSEEFQEILGGPRRESECCTHAPSGRRRLD
jgi:hypothetical protein